MRHARTGPAMMAELEVDQTNLPRVQEGEQTSDGRPKSCRPQDQFNHEEERSEVRVVCRPDVRRRRDPRVFEKGLAVGHPGVFSDLSGRCLSVYFDLDVCRSRDVGARLERVGQIRERNVIAVKEMEDNTRVLFWLKHSCA